MYDPLTKPGALIRRLHQTSVKLFLEETADFDISPVQFGAVQVIADRPGIDQITLARETDTDRTTIFRILERLQKMGLVRKECNEENRRANLLYVTDAGMELISTANEFAEASQKKLLAPLPAADQKQFMQLVTTLVLAHAEHDSSMAKLARRANTGKLSTRAKKKVP